MQITRITYTTALLAAALTARLASQTGAPAAPSQVRMLQTMSQPGTVHYVSDLTWASATNGWGPAERDKSNGEQATGDGRTITLNGVTHTKGIGVHVHSDIAVGLGGACTTFAADVGVDDEVGTNGSVVFQVWGDSTRLFDSGVMRGADPQKPVLVSVAGVQTLRLVVTDAGDGVNYDHASWGGARVACGSTPTTSPPPPTTSGVYIATTDDPRAIVAAHPAGTTFIFRAGVHRMEGRTVAPRTGDRFVGEAGAILSGARLLTGFAKSGSYWVQTGQTQDLGTHGTCRSGVPRCNRSEELFLDDVRLRHVGTLAEVGPGRWYFDYAADAIYIGDDPTGRKVETSVQQSAFYNSTRSNNDSVSFEGLIFEKFASRAQSGVLGHNAGSGWTVKGNTFRLNHGYGLRTDGNGMQVLQNKVVYNGQLGIGGSAVSNVLIEQNEIAYNNQAAFDPGWEAGGTKWSENTDLVVRGNWVHHNLGPGLWTDINNYRTLYENNTVEDNNDIGIFHEISYDAVIRNNVVRRNGHSFKVWRWGAGICVAASPNVEVYGNTLEGNAQGIVGLAQNRGTGSRGPWLVRNLWVHDNTIRQSEGATGVVQDFGDTEIFTATGNNRFDRNTYYLPAGGGNMFDWANATRTDTQWRSYGHDVNGTINRQ